MGVWQKPALAHPDISGSEGTLVSVSICVEPRRLEFLLEALALVSFPINPQIYHDATLVYVYPDQHRESETITVVEFPAYTGQLDLVRTALREFGFDPSNLQVTRMLDEIAGDIPGPAPAGAAYEARYIVKRRAAVH